ncbi:M48 family metallopeptidase, partial [Nostoc sp. CHAB 5834]|nr:M48 family metallopeptidase [Nostoc sp. CHAB 5834]
ASPMFKSKLFKRAALLTLLLAMQLPLSASAEAPTPEQISFVKACSKDPARKRQAYAASQRSAVQLQQENGREDPPLKLKLILQKLVRASNRAGQESAFQLIGYEHAQPNAHLAGPTSLLVSSAVWKSSDRPLSLNEQAALLAHELAHLEQDDPVLWGCFALSLSEDKGISIGQAIADALNNTKSPMTKQFLHELELSADSRAKEILEDADFGPEGLISLIRRPDVTPEEETFSHPSRAARLAN